MNTRSRSYCQHQKILSNYPGFFIFLIDNSEGKSYINFTGTELSYELDKDNTSILKEIFSDTKH